MPSVLADRLRHAIDRGIAFARQVAQSADNEADARRATSVLYHVTSAVQLAAEAGFVIEKRGDARRLLLAQLVLDHRLAARDPFALEAGASEQAIADLLLDDRPAPLDAVRALLRVARPGA